MREPFEMAMMLGITGVTNFCMLPAVVCLYRSHLPFEASIGMFTMITSFFYHCCDSIDGPLWLSEGQWHRLDNIGSIMSFICWIIYLMDLRRAQLRQYLQYFFLSLVLVSQEKNPWDELLSFIPIGMALVTLFCSFILQKRVPKYKYSTMWRGLVLLAIGLAFFIRGLDDDTDPFRVFHGSWHAFVGAAAYFNFQVLPVQHYDATAVHIDKKDK